MAYTSNLSIEQYNEIQAYLPIKKTTRPKKWTSHQILNALMYVLVSGCQWRNLPNDLPPWKTVYTYFRIWSKSGVIDQILKKNNIKISPVYRTVAKTYLFDY
jgi:putative transposase